ncbi:MAG: hydroxylamine reductase [Deferrisomatales bacterium]
MLCNQCEQTVPGTGCTTHGVCGKDRQVAALQDLLTYAVRGLSQVAVAARARGIVDSEANRLAAKALFATLTNVNFDPERFVAWVHEAVRLRRSLEGKVRAAGAPLPEGDPAVAFEPTGDLDGLTAQGEAVRLPIDWDAPADVRSLQELTLYGVRGAAAYAYHAAILGREDDGVYASLQQKLARLGDNALGVEDWVKLALDTGKTNLRAMELLDEGNTGCFGHPEPTQVSLGPAPGKAILVSGHDLKDLADLLQQTRGTGVSVYTHGEMLPAHAYPELKKYDHLRGHYGTAWQNQREEFARFPGAILMTTNCLQEPRGSYRDNLFTTGLVGWPGVTHVGPGGFGPVIDKALEMPGFSAAEERGAVWVGYARNTVLRDHPMGRVIDTVVDYVKAGKIRHFFLVGGCDGAKPGRNYYTEFVDKAPPDTVVLTLACGKFRFFDKDLGAIDGVPRLLDVGQCNDAYSAIAVAGALAEALGVGLNELPLSLVLSWYEQKAVAILLTLLHLGVQGIRLGPSLPAFVTPNVLEVLAESFGIRPIGDVDDDLAQCLAR